jgi:hypothetical protein
VRTLGLVDVKTVDLENALRGVHRGTLPCPLGPAGLAGNGLQHVQESLLGSMRGLDEAGVRAVLVAVLAERRR